MTGTSPDREPIAIVGIGCRFPGGVDGGDALFRLLCDGKDAVTEIPRSRFDIDALYDPRPSTPGKIVSKAAGIVDGLDRFDPAFFDISPREAEAMDPQQRLLLETAWEALEEAGLTPARGKASPGGVFVGMCSNDFEDLHFQARILRGDPVDLYALTGSARSTAAGRVSYALGLVGPSVVIDAACASSLVAVHLACQSLIRGECSFALAGGVNLLLHPDFHLGFSRAGMLSPDGRCKSFDASANGFVRSDGAAFVALRPLREALADGDRVYAVIRGGAFNNDGATGDGMSTPSPVGQELVLRAAYKDAGIDPASVHYVEAHGTGTGVGDPIEARALGAVLGAGRPSEQPCILGSVKSNIGHTEGAAGIAGLIKAALVLHHGVIPPTVHFTRPNPAIGFAAHGLRVAAGATEAWPAGDRPRRAGVSSFGINGTNAHLVLEEAPPRAGTTESTSAKRPSIVVLSGHTAEALDARARALAGFVREGRASLEDVAYTAAARRRHLEHRLAILARSTGGLADDLEAELRAEPRPNVVRGRARADRPTRVAFVFPGQGSQWIGMARRLLEDEPVFRAALERCDAAFRTHVSWSLVGELACEREAEWLAGIDRIQPALFAIQVALAELFRSWGIVPDAVVGHSMGEVAAAHVAGALTLEDAARVICLRSQAVMEVSGQGAMWVVALSLAEAEQAIAGSTDRVSVAANNSPTSTILSGDPEVLSAITKTLEDKGVFCRQINVAFASHCPQMDPLANGLSAALAALRPRAGTVPIYSTLLEKQIAGDEMDASYWVRNLRQPVFFAGAVEQLVTSGHDVFLEVSPHPILLSAIQESLHALKTEAACVPALRRNEEPDSSYCALAALHTHGVSVDPHALAREGQLVALPAYPWQRERHWKFPVVGTSTRRTALGGHPLLGVSIRSPREPGTHVYESHVGIETLSYLTDHRVQGAAVFPAAGYVEMARAIAVELLGKGAHTLEGLEFREALFLPETGSARLHVVARRQESGLALEFLRAGEEDGTITHAVARVAAAEGEWHATADLGSAEARCTALLEGSEHYAAAAARGLEYGPTFQAVQRVYRQPGEAVAELAAPTGLDLGSYAAHPAFLDACFQVLIAALGGEDTFLPVGIDRLRIHGRLGPTARGHVRLRSSEGPVVTGDLVVVDHEGRIVLEAEGLSAKRLEERAAHGDDDFVALAWRDLARPASEPRKGPWLILADGAGVGDELAKTLARRGDACWIVRPGAAFRALGENRFELDPGSAEDAKSLRAALEREGQPAGIVHLFPVDVTDDVDRGATLGCEAALHVVQAFATEDACPRLWLVTRGAVRASADPEPLAIAAAPLWGFGRVLAYEIPALATSLVDLDPLAAAADAAAALAGELDGDGGEQVAFRGGIRRVGRLTRGLPPESPRVARSPAAYRLDTNQPGDLDALRLCSVRRHAPGRGVVEVEVSAASLNFIDVMKALGVYPGQTAQAPVLGFDASGTVSAVGEGVTRFSPGDPVVVVTPGALASIVHAPEVLAVRRPPELDAETAAALPIAYLTAIYGLEHLARLQPGERVLVHGAAGGVGLAAVAVAKRLGAEVFATAGSEAKRAHLVALGVRLVSDSRSLAFADEVREATDGEGVDVVLSSVTGEAMRQSLLLLRPRGRFVEIGKKDIYAGARGTPLPTEAFKKNLAYFSVDVAALLGEDPALAGRIVKEALADVASGGLPRLPVRAFDAKDATDAFRTLAGGQTLGKLVLRFGERPAHAEAAVARVRPDATYLVTGGLGALGLAIAAWLAEQGARHLVLTGRSAPSAATRAALAELRRSGVDVRVALADVTDEPALARVVAAIDDPGAPLRGVVHGAAVLDDGIVPLLDKERLRRVLAPKVLGTFHLHRLTERAPLDFFVLMSSAASLVGSPGQAAYSAGNAFLDALAHHRRALGLPAVAINWGPWSEIGLAARPDRGGRLANRGLASLSPARGLAAFGRLLRQGPPQVAVMPFDLARWQEHHPEARSLPVFAELAREAADAAKTPARTAAPRLRDEVVAAPEDRRVELISAYLAEQASRVLRMTKGRLDLERPLQRLGLDSLMAVELKNRIDFDLGIAVRLMDLLKGTSVTSLAKDLDARLPREAADEWEDGEL